MKRTSAALLLLALWTPFTATAETEILAVLDSIGKVAQKVRTDSTDENPLWKCTPKTSFTCSATGCKKGKNTGWLLLDFKEAKYERCDSIGCESFPFNYTRQGDYSTFGNAQAALKLKNDASFYSESASDAEKVIVTFGSCAPR